MACGPRWVPLRLIAVPSQGTPQTATSILPARRSSGVRQTGSLLKVWNPSQDGSISYRLRLIGPGGRLLLCRAPRSLLMGPLLSCPALIAPFALDEMGTPCPHGSPVGPSSIAARARRHSAIDD